MIRRSERFRSQVLCSPRHPGSEAVTTADKPLPGADLQPIEDAPEQPEKKSPKIPEEDDPAITETEEQPS